MLVITRLAKAGLSDMRSDRSGSVTCWPSMIACVLSKRRVQLREFTRCMRVVSDMPKGRRSPLDSVTCALLPALVALSPFCVRK